MWSNAGWTMEWSFVFNSPSDDSKSGYKEYEVTGGCGPLIASGKHITEIPSTDVLASRNGAPRLANRRILVVEDEIFVAMAIEDALVSSGAEVIGPAMSVSRGLELLDNETALDGAILDVNVDDQLVFPLAERLRDKGIPIIFHTAYVDSAKMDSSFPDAIICIKPVLNEELVAQAAARFE